MEGYTGWRSREGYEDKPNAVYMGKVESIVRIDRIRKQDTFIYNIPRDGVREAVAASIDSLINTIYAATH